jgi:hypothetical protein
MDHFDNIQTLVYRLEVIKNLILLNEISLIKDQTNKLKDFQELNLIASIILLLEHEKYIDANFLIIQKLEQLQHSRNPIKATIQNITAEERQENNIDNIIKLIPYRKVDKWGFCNPKKEIEIDCDYDEVNPFFEGRAIVCKNNKWGLIDENGEIISDMDFENIYPFTEGIARVSKFYPEKPLSDRRKYGFINLNGELIVPLVYDEVKPFSQGLAMIGLDGERGFIDTEGNIVLEMKYSDNNEDKDEGALIGWHEESYIFREGFCVVAITHFGGQGVINKEGDVIIPFNKFICIRTFSEGLAAVCKEIKIADEEYKPTWGFVDKIGNEIIPCKFDYVSSFREGLAIVEQNGKHGYINQKGIIVIPCIYKAAMPFSEGLAAVLSMSLESNNESADYKWGYIDKKGKIVIPFLYSGEYSLYEGIPTNSSMRNGLISAKKNDKSGYINKYNEIVIDMKYILAYSFKNEIAYVRITDYTPKGATYIDKYGTEYYED